jgi:hypothetical protein
MVELFILDVFLFILAVGGLIADYVFPHIRPLEKFIDSLPIMQDEWGEGEEDGPL